MHWSFLDWTVYPKWNFGSLTPKSDLMAQMLKTKKTKKQKQNKTNKQNWRVGRRWGEGGGALLRQNITFHHDQMKRVGENEANKFCFALTLWLPGKVKVSESGIKWHKLMVPISMAGMKISVTLTKFRNDKVSVTEDGWVAVRLYGQTWLLHWSIWYTSRS